MAMVPKARATARRTPQRSVMNPIRIFPATVKPETMAMIRLAVATVCPMSVR